LDDLFFGMSGSFHGVGLVKTLSSNPAQSQGEAQIHFRGTAGDACPQFIPCR
jgi:hypothetical protein